MVPSSRTRPMQQQGHLGLKFVQWTQHRASAIHPGLITLWSEIFPPSVLIWMGILWHADGWAVGSSFSFICCLLLYINKQFHNAEMRTNNDARTESMTQSWQAMRVNGQNHKQWEWQWEWSNESWQAMRVNGQNHKQWAYLWFLILSYEDRNIEGFHDINPFKMDLMHAPWSHHVPWPVMSPKLPHVPQGRGRCRGGNWNS